MDAYLAFPHFHHAHVVVVGDVMLDCYLYGEAKRISPEAPVPVVSVARSEFRPGGAANVALNLAALGVKVVLVGWIGDDEHGQLLTQKLQQAGVQCELIPVPHFPTIVKTRVMGQHQQLLRFDHEKFFSGDSESLLMAFRQHLVEAQAVILSDYGKGTLREVQKFIAEARQYKLPIVVDPKATTFAPYAGATLITPNRKEMAAVIGQTESEEELIAKTQAQIQQNQLHGIVITRSEQGMLLVMQDQPALNLPAQARDVFDVTGAGDTVIAVLGAMLGLQYVPAEAAKLANVAAGLVVAKLGTATISVSELQHALRRVEGARTGIVDEAVLVDLLADCRSRGEKIVITNGCFDILHAGHVQYLEEAAALGDRLVIAVNGDESVRRLKGDNRPVNNLAARMALLASLRVVDWVVSFHEDTPARLYETLQPDVLVKGGDYCVDNIVGAQSVLQRGGRVEVLSFKPGFSTTALLAKIKEGAEA